MSALAERDLIVVGEEAYTPEEWARCKGERAAYRQRPEIKAKQAAYRRELQRLARLAKEAGLG